MMDEIRIVENERFMWIKMQWNSCPLYRRVFNDLECFNPRVEFLNGDNYFRMDDELADKGRIRNEWKEFVQEIEGKIQ